MLENWWVFAVFAGVLLISSLVSVLFSRSFYKRASSGEKIAAARKWDEFSSEEEFDFSKSGRHGNFENAEFELPEKDFFGNEKTELPETFEEALSGLSDNEKEKILAEAGLSEEEGNR